MAVEEGRRVHGDALRLQIRKVGHRAVKRPVHHSGRQRGRAVWRYGAASVVLPLAQTDLGAGVVAVDEHEAGVGLALPVARPRQALRRVGPGVRRAEVDRHL